MPNLSIKNVPADVVDRLHERAASNHRSLQGELMALVTAAAGGITPLHTEPPARHTGPGDKSIEQIAAEHSARVERPITRGGRSVDLIRADRDAR